MPALTAEFFTDPLSPWCWAAQPTIRRLTAELEDVELVPRSVLLLPDTSRADLLPDGVSAEQLGAHFSAAVRGSGMPAAPELWDDAVPTSSWPACAAVASVREAAPGRVEAFLHRVREAAFAAGEPVDETARLVELAREVGGIDAGALERALADGGAAAALEGDLERAREVAREIDAGAEVRGTVRRLPAAPRRADGTVPAPSIGADEAGADADPSSDDEEADADELVGPPAIRFGRDDGVVVANPHVGYSRLVSIAGRSIPRSVEGLSDKYGTGRLAVHVPREVAESLSSRDFLPAIRSYVERFDRVFVAEVAAGTGLSPRTCRSGLETLAARGAVRRVDEDGHAWRTIDGGRAGT